MPRAGYTAAIRRAINPTAGTALPMTHLGARVHRITTSSTRVVDPNQPWSLVVAGVTVSYASVQSVDWLYGEVTTASLTGVPTLNCTYLTLEPTGSSTMILEVKSHQWEEASDLLETTVYTSSTPIRKRIYGIRDASFNMDVFVSSGQMIGLATTFSNGSRAFFELNSGFSAVWRAVGYIEKISRTSAVDGLVEANVSFVVDCHQDPNNSALTTSISERLI